MAAWWSLVIGPLIAVVLAFRLRPIHLTVLGIATLAGFVMSWNITNSLYPDCLDTGCPPMEHRLVWVNGILLSITVALSLLALLKGAAAGFASAA
jgi:hypothetical protein